MEMMEFIAMISPPVLVAIVAVLAVVTLFLAYKYLRMAGLNGIRARVYELILKAEHRYEESGTGQQKLKWVVQQARGLLPPWLQLVISEDTLMNIVNEWFLGVKDLLDDGKVNNSQKRGGDTDEYHQKIYY